MRKAITPDRGMMTVSKPSDQRFRVADARFRIVFEQSPVSTQIFAPDGQTLTVNRAWERLWGVTLDQIAGYNILEDEQLVSKGIMPYIERGFAGEQVAIPAIKYEPDQTMVVPGAVPYRWVRASIYPVRNEDGDIEEVVLMHEDITEQRDAEDALRASEARLQAILDNSPAVIFIKDLDGCYLLTNRRFEELWGVDRANLQGQRDYDIFPPDVAGAFRANDREVLEAGQPIVREEVAPRDDGLHTFLSVKSPLFDQAGAPYAICGISTDITDRKRAEEELEQLAAERAATLRQITEGIVIADADGRIAFVNEAAMIIHGVAELGIPVERYADVYHLYTMDGVPYPAEELPLARAVRDGETVIDARWIIRRADGSEVVAEGGATPVVAEDGTRLGAVVTIRDITDQYHLERQKQHFLSAVAHDLRTPLTTIKGRAQILRTRIKRGALGAPELAAGLERIDDSATRMIALISDLLDVANLQIGRPPQLDLQEVDLVALARGIAEEHQQASDRYALSIASSVPSLMGRWDPLRIQRVLANLISNAVKYSGYHGAIAVEVTRDEGPDGAWAVLVVRDEGVGIPADDLPFIFDRFRRGGNVAGRVVGSGIGLTAVREIVLQHGGTISVDSQEGTGSTFTVRLPL